LLALLTAAVWQAPAQTFDNSGNSMLQGTYYFREVIWVLGDSAGDLSQAVALYGNITFNAGSYSMAVTVNDSNSGLASGTLTGTYTISASGYGFITMPATIGGWNVYGLVS